jgi:hypothetical protein
MTTLDITTPVYVSGDLEEGAIADLRVKFEEWGVSLPGYVWEEHHTTAFYLENMANGNLTQKAYLNTLWTSAGKTTLMICFVGRLVQSQHHRNVGVIICLPYLKQILTLIELAKLEPSQFAVYVNEDAAYEVEENSRIVQRKYNNLSDTPINKAQVLFTTQAMIESRLAKGANFGDLQYFYYNDQPRQVKIWDEELLCWEELCLSVSDLFGVSRCLNFYKPELGKRIRSIALEIERTEQETYHFPNLELEFGISWEEIRSDLKELEEKVHDWERRSVYTLWKVAGKEVAVHKDADAETLIEWKQSLPEDMFPIVVFDASGKLRTMYDYYKEATEKLKIITEIDRNFEHLTFHHVDIGGGKTAWKRRPEPLKKLTQALISLDPERKTLVIVHKPQKGKRDNIPDIEKDLSSKCPNASWLSWGSHRQTNDFRDFDRLVVPGLFYLPQAVIKVRTHGSRQVPTKIALAEEYFWALERGEVMNDLLQAVGRIARASKDGAPMPADIIVVASSRKHGPIRELLQDAFPGSKYKRLKPPKETEIKDPTTKTDLLGEVLRSHFSKTPEMNLPFKHAKSQIPKIDKKGWKRLRQHPEIKAICRELGIEEAANDNRSYSTHWRKAA